MSGKADDQWAGKNQGSRYLKGGPLASALHLYLFKSTFCFLALSYFIGLNGGVVMTHQGERANHDESRNDGYKMIDPAVYLSDDD